MEAILWQKERNGVRCYQCGRRCFIARDKKGFCKVKENKNNRLYATNYGKIVGKVIENVERNPIFHFYPGTQSLFTGVLGCNVHSSFCSSFELSRGLHEEDQKLKVYTPEDIVKHAEKNKCKSISFTYTEPFVSMEFNLRAAKLAYRANTKNIFVTNGLASEEGLKKIVKYLNALVINIKASLDSEFYEKFMNIKDTEPIYTLMKKAKKYRIFTEVTNLIIPQIGDNIDKFIQLVDWITSEIGPEVPFHILPFYPEYAMTDLPATPTPTLETCASEALKAGLRYVFIDNSPILTGENTYCYNCGELLIERLAGNVKKINLMENRCPSCGVKINIIR